MLRAPLPLVSALLLAGLLAGCSSTTVDKTAGWSPNRIHSEAQDEMNSGAYDKAVPLFRPPYGQRQADSGAFFAGQGLRGGVVHIDGSVSSQFLTAFLMAAPLASGDTRIQIKGELVSKPYIDITLHIMRQFGVTLTHDNYQTFHIQGHQQYVAPGDFLVEGDASSASYFLAAGVIKGKVRVTGIGKHSIQGDIRFADVLETMGGKITWGDDFIEAEQGELHGVDLDLNHIPDAAMTIATTALFATGKTVIRNIYNWRVKETDRLSAMATELRKLGAEVVEVTLGDRILKDAINEALRAWISSQETTHYCFGTAAGPHPFPLLVRELQSVIGRETRAQKIGRASCRERVSSPV